MSDLLALKMKELLSRLSSKGVVLDEAHVRAFRSLGVKGKNWVHLATNLTPEGCVGRSTAQPMIDLLLAAEAASRTRCRVRRMPTGAPDKGPPGTIRLKKWVGVNVPPGAGPGSTLRVLADGVVEEIKVPMDYNHVGRSAHDRRIDVCILQKPVRHKKTRRGAKGAKLPSSST